MSNTAPSPDMVERMAARVIRGLHRLNPEHVPMYLADALIDPISALVVEAMALQRELDGAAALKAGSDMWNDTWSIWDDHENDRHFGYVQAAEEIYTAITGTVVDISMMPKEVTDATP